MTSKLIQQLLSNRGIIINILGPVLVDLRFIYNVSLDESTYFTVAVNIGYLSGSLGFWVYGRLNRQLVMAFFVLVMGVSSALVPHYGSFWMLMGGFVLYGIGTGAWDSACEIWMIEIFPIGNAGMLQFLQFMYGVGSVIAPLLVAPFVKGEQLVNNSTGLPITPEDRIQSLTMPFVVSGVGSALISGSLVLLFIFRRYKPTVLGKEAFAEEAAAKVDPTTVKSRGFEAGHLWPLSGFLLRCGDRLRPFVQSVCSATFTLGRLVTAFIATRLLPDIIVAYHMVTFMIGLAIVFFGRDSETVIIVGSAVLGYAFSAIWPAMFAFTERHLRLSHRVCSTYCFLAGLLSLTVPLVLGQTFQGTPMILFAIEVVFFSAMFAAFTLVNVLIYRDTGKVFR
ncbi:hypothetical protein TYRP_020133 [Tyrophagus putrescentiae]|nr:hypothetical protein TYRP_020133 [Tyrophagus putrescentiae]